jgi:hypothetical protein
LYGAIRELFNVESWIIIQEVDPIGVGTIETYRRVTA